MVVYRFRFHSRVRDPGSATQADAQAFQKAFRDGTPSTESPDQVRIAVASIKQRKYVQSKYV